MTVFVWIAFIMVSEFPLVCRLRSQFLERTQESDDIFPA
jgi:hypothetical protein